MTSLLASLLLVACKAADPYPVGPMGDDQPPLDTAPPQDAHLDAPLDGANCGTNIPLVCDVAITCSGEVSHFPDTACADANTPSYDTVAQAVIADAMQVTSCTAGATYFVTCTAPPNQWPCPLGIEFERDVTACVAAQPYNSPMVADVCAHLPAGEAQCSVACDANALKQYAMPGKPVTTFTCESTDHIIFIVAARP